MSPCKNLTYFFINSRLLFFLTQSVFPSPVSDTLYCIFALAKIVFPSSTFKLDVIKNPAKRSSKAKASHDQLVKKTLEDLLKYDPAVSYFRKNAGTTLSSIVILFTALNNLGRMHRLNRFSNMERIFLELYSETAQLIVRHSSPQGSNL